MEIQRNAMEYYIFKQLKYNFFDGNYQKNTTKYKNQGKYQLECGILFLAKRSIYTEKSVGNKDFSTRVRIMKGNKKETGSCRACLFHV